MSYKSEALAYSMDKVMEEKWKIKNDQDAEWIIEKTKEQLVESDRYKLALENKIKDLQEKLKKAKEEDMHLKARRDTYLTQYFETIPDEFKKKTKTQEKFRLPSGEIIKKYPGPEFKRDDEKLKDWLVENKMSEYIEVKTTPKWGELKKSTKVAGGQVVLTDTGEIIKGVEVIERPPVMEFKEV